MDVALSDCNCEPARLIKLPEGRRYFVALGTIVPIDRNRLVRRHNGSRFTSVIARRLHANNADSAAGGFVPLRGVGFDLRLVLDVDSMVVVLVGCSAWTTSERHSSARIGAVQTRACAKTTN